MEFSFDEYYSRHFPLSNIGRDNQIRLTKRTVLVAGVGGLGTTSSALMASLGVGHIKLVDFDVIEQSNLPRQELYTLSDVGKAKVDVAMERITKRNPSIRVSKYTISIDGLSLRGLLDDVDLIIDGLDSFAPRRALHSAAYDRRIPYVFAGAISNNGNIISFTFKENTPCMVCVLGYPDDDDQNTCAVRGVHPSVLNVVASLQVAEGIRILLEQQPVLEGRMLYIDIETMDFDKITFKKNPNCQECKRVEQGLEKGKEGEVRRERFDLEGFGTVAMSSLCGKDTFIFTPKFEWTYGLQDVRDLLNEFWPVNFRGKSVLEIHSKGATCSLMSSGVMTIRGSGSKSNAVKIFKDILNILGSVSSST